jgi:ketosteroid isomerase-like protein
MITAKRKLSSVLAAVAVLVCLLDTRVQAAPRNDLDDVRNAVVGFATSWNRHDMDAFGKLFAPDAEFVNVAGVVWTGRQSIQAQHAYSHAAIPADSPDVTEGDRPYYGIFKNSTIKFDQVDVRFLRNDVAIAHVQWELLGDARTQSNPRRGVFLFVLTRQSSAWLIAVAQNTEINRTVK